MPHPSPLILTLPWPPSVNSYWRHPTRGALAGRHLISQEGRLYRSSVATLTTGMAGAFSASMRLSVSIYAAPPDNRRRDLDNLPKAVLDALTHAQVWPDDSQLDRLLIERVPVQKGGMIRVEIEVLP